MLISVLSIHDFSFGSTAIDNFLENNQLSYIIRAHEAHAHGVSLSKGARYVTVGIRVRVIVVIKTNSEIFSILIREGKKGREHELYGSR